MIDLVFPNGNEAEILVMGKKLGWKNLCFAYEFTNIADIKAKIKAHTHVAVVAKQSNFMSVNFAKTVILKVEAEPTPMLRNGKVNAAIGMENYRLRQVHCKFAKESDMALCFGLSQMLERPKLLGWLHKNSRLVNKYKVPLILGSFAKTPMQMRSYQDLVGLYTTLGFDKKLIKNGFEFLEKTSQ